MNFDYNITPSVVGKRVMDQLATGIRVTGIRVTGDNINSRRGEGVIQPLLYEQQPNGRFLYDLLTVDFVALAYDITSVYNIKYKGMAQTYKYVIRHYCADAVTKENVETALRVFRDSYTSNGRQIRPFLEDMVTKHGVWLPHAILSLDGLTVEFCTANGLEPPPPLPTEVEDSGNPSSS